MSLSFDSAVSLLPGVGPTRALQLQELGISTIQDLLFDAPFRYETVEREVSIADLVADTTVCIHADVVSKIPIKTARFRSMLKVKVKDDSGSIDLTWFNNQFVLSSLKIGESYYFTGKVSFFKNHPTITNPTVEKVAPLYGSLVPIYHESADIHSRYLRKLIRTAFEQADLSDQEERKAIYEKYKLVSLKAALGTLHALDPALTDLKKARERLAFDELFSLIANVLERKKAHQEARSIAKLSATNDEIKAFFSLLPYAPTPSQKEAIQAISLDLVQPHPMHRLIQGEVGSGKTTVAAFALWIAAKHGHQAVLICPTNILAQQHAQTLRTIFQATTTRQHVPSVGLYTSTLKEEAEILVATHAIFQEKKLRPAVVIVDEEHRFGVEQREFFLKHTKKPHFLSMTATPIPRTVALTALADRDVSFLTPHKDNTNIKTWVVPTAKRTASYTWMKKMLTTTQQQALIVCPFIEESLVENLASIKSAKKEFENLKKIFSTFRLELLHGKLPGKEKDQLFAKMMTHETDILVTTPVVEVGVDIPKASLIIIEGCERYGLAQLHQLRGRVGRRGQEAYCLLFTTDGAEEQSRLSFFAKTYDGNKLAEYDLKHRGSGDLLGLRQHGFDSLRFASWSDEELIRLCKSEVEMQYAKP